MIKTEILSLKNAAEGIRITVPQFKKDVKNLAMD